MKYKNEVGYTLEDMYLHFTNKNIINRVSAMNPPKSTDMEVPKLCR